MGNKLFSRYLEARWGVHAAPIETVAACPLCAGGVTGTLWGFLLKKYLVYKENTLFINDILLSVPSDSFLSSRSSLLSLGDIVFLCVIYILFLFFINAHALCSLWISGLSLSLLPQH